MKVVALLVLSCLAGVATGQSLRLGVAETDITPPTGSAMAGYYNNREATGVHDPIHAKAMVLSDGTETIAMVACDVVGLPNEVTDKARAIASQKTGFAIDHIMVTATHSHTSGVILTNPTRYNLPPKVMAMAKQYADSLPAKIAAAIELAKKQLRPVVMMAGVGEEDTLGFSRRYFMRDGSVGWNPGKLNPDIVRPAGPVDRGVPVLYFEEPKDEKPIAAYVNFGLHQDTTGGLKFSADYAYTLERVMKFAKGDDFFTLFTIGAAGNVNHFDVSRKDPQQGYEEAARIGAVLAGEVLKVIQAAKPVVDIKIRVSDEMVPIAVPTYTEAELAEAIKTQATQGTASPAPFLDLVKSARILELNARHGKPIDAEVQIMTIGDTVAIAAFPGEMFAAFGIQLKEDSPFPVTVMAELANGEFGYIPNRVAFEEGNYEPITARLSKGSGELLMDSAQRQLLKLARRTANAQ